MIRYIAAIIYVCLFFTIASAAFYCFERREFHAVENITPARPAKQIATVKKLAIKRDVLFMAATTAVDWRRVNFAEYMQPIAAPDDAIYLPHVTRRGF